MVKPSKKEMKIVSEKTDLEELAKELVLDNPNAWEKVTLQQKEEIFQLGQEYKKFLDKSKTERETVHELLKAAETAGFVKLNDSAETRTRIEPGQKFYSSFRDKAVLMGVLGSNPLEEGFRLIGSHVDSPRLDLKPKPLYQKNDLALFKTHYYGGVKKYQWTAIPLALHGVVVLESGKTVSVAVGESEDDPVFTITDLLPHLAGEQSRRKLSEGIKGEELNILVGSIPLEGEGFKETVKLAVLKHLKDDYGITEEDFTSAELEVVPAGKARDVGFDRSMVGGYGQDDRICVFASWKAIEGLRAPKNTCIILFADKEEIGSTGNTGMQSRILEEFLMTVSRLSNQTINLSRVFYASEALSADVNAAYDPTWEDVMDKYNAAKLGFGVCLTKYTGARGKVEANDAHAEFLAHVRRLFKRHGVVWQTGELGKVDYGGGGTIAKFLSNLNINVVDCGMPVLSMHAPFEVTSKVDLFMGYKAFCAFLQDSEQ